MKIDTISDIIRHTKAFHKMAADYYMELSENSNKERLKILLNYLAIHEKHLEETFAEYEDVAGTIVIDFWIKYNSCDDKLYKLQNSKFSPATYEELIELAIELDECVIKMFKYLRDNAKTEELRNIFNDILKLEKNESRLAIKNLSRLSDL